MRLETPQIVQSAQVWVCDTCGGQDHKSCGCNSTARMEELAAKREANRQAVRAHREKAQQNQQSRNNYTPVENIEETETGGGDDDQTVFRRGLMFRAKAARAGAEYENWKKFKVDRLMVEEANAAAAAWSKLAEYLE